VLAKYLEHAQLVCSSPSCTGIELGAGTGLAGLALAALGAKVHAYVSIAYTTEALVYARKAQVVLHDLTAAMRNTYASQEVVLTDLPYALDNLAANVQRNAHLWQDHSCSVSVLPLDWYSEDLGSLSGRTFDLILAADVVWLDELVPPLVRTLERLTASETAQRSRSASSAASGSSSSSSTIPSSGSTSSHQSTTILLSYQERSRATTALLMRELQQCFTVQAVPTAQLHPRFRSDKIAVYTIHRRLHTYLMAYRTILRTSAFLAIVLCEALGSC
jgi:predicted nicotinamide N-methyase